MNARREFVEAFEREARLTRKVFREQLHVRQVLDLGVLEEGGEPRPWMAMELLEGETLEEHLRPRRGAPPTLGEREAVEFLGPVLDAVAFAHQHGVVHRDLKPANVFMAGPAVPPCLKVLDFGIAKLLAEGDELASGNTMTASALQMFSHQYGAPEQFGGKKTGKYTDVFALGLVLTELLTNKKPLSDSGERIECMTAALDRRERPTPRARGRQVSEALEAVLAKAAAYAEGERYPDAEVFARELRAAVGLSSLGPTGASSATSATSRILAELPTEMATTSFTERVPEFDAAHAHVPAVSAAALPSPRAEPATASATTAPAAASAGPRPLPPLLWIGGGALALAATSGYFLFLRTPRPAPAQLSALTQGSSSSGPPAIPSAAPPELASATHPAASLDIDASAATALADADVVPDAGLPGDAFLGDYSCSQNPSLPPGHLCRMTRDKSGKLLMSKISGGGVRGFVTLDAAGELATFNGRAYDGRDGQFGGAGQSVQGRLVKSGANSYQIAGGSFEGNYFLFVGPRKPK